MFFSQGNFFRYGPLKEIWLASYAPFYAFIVFRNRADAQVKGNKQNTKKLYFEQSDIFSHQGRRRRC